MLLMSKTTSLPRLPAPTTSPSRTINKIYIPSTLTHSAGIPPSRTSPTTCRSSIIRIRRGIRRFIRRHLSTPSSCPMPERGRHRRHLGRRSLVAVRRDHFQPIRCRPENAGAPPSQKQPSSVLNSRGEAGSASAEWSMSTLIVGIAIIAVTRRSRSS
jgi:hypothetical protein